MTCEPVIQNFEANFDKHLHDLKILAKIPSVSFPGFDHATLDQSAKTVMGLLKETGLENIQILKVKNSFPYVYADWLKKKGAPTVLLYAHHDVQPIGRKDVWKTEPFTPTEKDGPGGKRLYGRGTADDKAGIVIHTASITSYLKTLHELPVNVKILIEGEEEIGSPHLLEFLKRHKKLLQADTMILTDTSNPDSGVPGLTVSLRGGVGLELEVRALNQAIHSGLWGGPIPDPVMGLTKILSTLVDKNGHIAVPKIRNMIPPLTSKEKKAFKNFRFNEKKFRKQAGILDGVKLIQNNLPVYATLWRYPSLTISAIQASTKNSPSILNDVAFAKVAIRLPFGMEAKKVCAHLKEHLKKYIPWGLKLKFLREKIINGWATDPHDPKQGDIFLAASRALEKGYAAKPHYIGCGGTISFVRPFAEILKVPALLIGVEDPYTNAHGENESLLVSDFKKAIRSEIYLFSELQNTFRNL